MVQPRLGMPEMDALRLGAPSRHFFDESQLDVIGVQRSKPGETAKIRYVQREDVANAMNIHCRRQARIMNLNARNAVA